MTEIKCLDANFRRENDNMDSDTHDEWKKLKPIVVTVNPRGVVTETLRGYLDQTFGDTPYVIIDKEEEPYRTPDQTGVAKVAQSLGRQRVQ
jgi:hypothetical protein